MMRGGGLAGSLERGPAEGGSENEDENYEEEDENEEEEGEEEEEEEEEKSTLVRSALMKWSGVKLVRMWRSGGRGRGTGGDGERGGRRLALPQLLQQSACGRREEGRWNPPYQLSSAVRRPSVS